MFSGDPNSFIMPSSSAAFAAQILRDMGAEVIKISQPPWESWSWWNANQYDPVELSMSHN